MATVYDLVDPQELQGYVREILHEENRNRLTLSSVLPPREIEGIEYRITQGVLRDQDAAPVRAFDTPAPIGRRQGVTRKSGELLPISYKIDLSEEQTLRKRALESGNNSRLVDAIFDDAANMARSVAVRVELLRGEALATGQINLDENGVNQVLDFERDAAHTDAPGVLWSDTANAVPVTDILAWNQTYKDTNGIPAAFALVSSTILADLSVNAQFRDLASFNGVTPSFLGLNEINNLLQRNNLPILVEYDTQVRGIDGTQGRVIAEDLFVMLPPANEPLGNTLWGETAESQKLVEAEQISAEGAAGLTATVMTTEDPVATWTKVSSVTMPILANPDLTFVADVA